MKTNLIQNFNIQTPTQRKNFGGDESLPNRTYCTPLPPHGKLVRSNIFNAPAVMIRDLKYDLKALKAAWNGKAKDHQLGNINDIGMKLGGLAIAAYLFTKKSAPSTKMMEFVGFGAFFGSMALWPKIALGIPAKLIHGVNIHQEYRTKQNVYDEKSLNVKKPFYQDPQYIPWDLYKDKDIQKIGDKLGVDKDLSNRREFIQEKMRKIALQNNTLWMLTAGFATPIMSALICNQAEKVMVPIMGKINDMKAEKLINNVDASAKKFDFSQQKADLNKVLAQNFGQPYNKKIIKEIAKNLAADLDPLVQKSLVEDLTKKFTGKEAIIDDTAIDFILKQTKESFEHQGEDFIASVVPDRKTLVQFFDDKGAFNKVLTQKESDALGIELTKFFKERARGVFGADKEAISDFGSDMLEIARDVFKVTPARKITEADIAELKEIREVVAKESARLNVFQEYSFRKVANSQETSLANLWNDVAKKLPKLLEITPKEMADTRYDRLLVQKLLGEKLEAIASDPKKTEAVLTELAKNLEKLEQKFPEDVIKNFEQKSDGIYDTLAGFFRGKGFKSTVKRLVGPDGGVEQGSSKRTEKEFIRERLSGVKHSFYRLVETVDVYRRLATIETNPHFQSMSKDGKEELVRLVKEVTLSGHSADFSVKFHQKYPNDINMFKQVSEFLFGNGGLSKEAATALDTITMGTKKVGESVERITMKNFFTDYKVSMIGKVVNAYNYFKPHHNLGSDWRAGTMERFLMVGVTPDELMEKLFKQSFNTNKWVKTFGVAGAALLGVTVGAQFFFGKLDPNQKMKTPTEEKK